METPACLQLAGDRQAPADIETVRDRQTLTFFPQLNWQKLSSLALIRLVALFAALGILSLASSALAALQRGDRGSQVTALQENLTATGYYDGPITGLFGSLTEEAVLRFQQANRLLVDGVVGSDTQLALQRQVGRIPTQTYYYPQTGRILQRGDSGSDVEDLQTRLQAAGYYDGPITGFYGTLTEAAVKRFQRDRGLYPYGIADLSTQAALSSPAVPNRYPPDFDNGSVSARRYSVLDLQKRLKQRGLYYGPLDDRFGPLTRDAVARAQRRYGVSSNDILAGRF